MRRYAREAKERETEKKKEMVEFEHGPTKGNKRERRRMQNRLAQRAFRARSKIQNKEVGPGSRRGVMIMDHCVAVDAYGNYFPSGRQPHVAP